MTMRISTKALRTIEKYGLEKAAKKYEMDLSKYVFTCNPFQSGLRSVSVSVVLLEIWVVR